MMLPPSCGFCNELQLWYSARIAKEVVGGNTQRFCVDVVTTEFGAKPDVVTMVLLNAHSFREIG